MHLDEFSPKLIFYVVVYFPIFCKFTYFEAFMLETYGKVFDKVQAIEFFSNI